VVIIAFAGVDGEPALAANFCNGSAAGGSQPAGVVWWLAGTCLSASQLSWILGHSSVRTENAG